MNPLPPFGDPTRPEAQAETYAEARVSGRTPQEAARIADYRGKRAERPLKFIETTEMRKRMQRALLRAGATPRKIGETVLSAMDATNAEGYADHRVRIQAAKLATEILAPEDRQAGQVIQSITLSLPQSMGEAFGAFLATKTPKTIEGS